MNSKNSIYNFVFIFFVFLSSFVSIGTFAHSCGVSVFIFLSFNFHYKCFTHSKWNYECYRYQWDYNSHCAYTHCSFAMHLSLTFARHRSTKQHIKWNESNRTILWNCFILFDPFKLNTMSIYCVSTTIEYQIHTSSGCFDCGGWSFSHKFMHILTFEQRRAIVNWIKQYVRTNKRNKKYYKSIKNKY